MSSGTSAPVKLVVVVAAGLLVMGAASLIPRQAPEIAWGNGGPASTERHPPPPPRADAPGPAALPARPASQPAPPTPSPKPDPHAARDPHDPAIVDAVAAGDLTRVAALHAQGVLLDGTLAIASRTGKVEVVRWLLDHGVDPHENEGSTQSPLLVADAHADVVKLLLDRGAGEPPIDHAIREPAPNAVARLLGKGGAPATATLLDAVTAADDDEPLRVAVVRAHVTRGAAVTSATLRAAMDLGGKNRDAVVDALLAAGAKLDRDATLDAAAHAAEKRDVATIKRLGAKGIAWTLYDGERGDPALVVAARALDVPTVRALLDAGEPIDQASSDGETALVAAMRPTIAADEDRVVAVAKVLLAKGANANKRLVGGLRPLDVADDGRFDDVAKLLVAHGAKRGRKSA